MTVPLVILYNFGKIEDFSVCTLLPPDLYHGAPPRSGRVTKEKEFGGRTKFREFKITTGREMYTLGGFNSISAR